MDLHRNSYIITTCTQYSGRKGDTGVSAFCFVPTRVAFGNTRIEKEYLLRQVLYNRLVFFRFQGESGQCVRNQCGQNYPVEVSIHSCIFSVFSLM